mmetsp:Transcript_26308/g.36672  ORF Transcript_26308/g.36672 Transcript_26308/m.36672 type:complete len:796 (-) Transcript_26308:188-2575(-)|eukprot:CAMPEP_0184490132 /NCGR_PEP_ID=MMETSP0113_2-20130426/17193_1 /TAXON_ID=91329 /ORGANISM="Norrisiella sphaerica, Strain BC52" /LENGTH=795 /DNA_ID=CAMNT_0026873891 /DNA_START=62 /DNA_END=2449 /DNA_ORIENTATION=-
MSAFSRSSCPPRSRPSQRWRLRCLFSIGTGLVLATGALLGKVSRLYPVPQPIPNGNFGVDVDPVHDEGILGSGLIPSRLSVGRQPTLLQPGMISSRDAYVKVRSRRSPKFDSRSLHPLFRKYRYDMLAEMRAYAEGKTESLAEKEESSSATRQLSLTERAFRQADEFQGLLAEKDVTQASGAGGVTSYKGLLRADALWSLLRNTETKQPPEFVRRVRGADAGTSLDEYDAVICGGTLGIFAAMALKSKSPNLNIAVVERGELRGRDQDWNIARSELARIVEYGILSREELEEAIAIEFNPMRVGFKTPTEKGFSVDVQDVLNVGVSPKKLIESTKQRFLKAGGSIYEKVSIEGIDIAEKGVTVKCSSLAPEKDRTNLPGTFSLSARLIIDAMGGGSPLAKQARSGKKPDGVCIVVGSCARGDVFEEKNKEGGDLIYSFTPVVKVPTLADGETFMSKDGSTSSKPPPFSRNSSSEMQYFWEAFPASSGPTDRTTYMFAYLDTHPSRPSLQRMFQEYFKLLPEYQGWNGSVEELMDADRLQFTRMLFATFPSYADSPIQYPRSWDRITSIGDASGVQSPLSFGGFGALLRHLPRSVNGISDSLDKDLVDRDSLDSLSPYLPNLASTWMMQRSMSAPVTDDGNMMLDIFRPSLLAQSSQGPNLIASILANTFEQMLDLDKGKGDKLQPFLQDVVQPDGLLGSLASIVAKKPQSVPGIIRHVGPGPIAEWVKHVSFMLLYALGNSVLSERNLRDQISRALENDPKAVFKFNRLLEALEYGSGGDFESEPGRQPPSVRQE